MKKTRAKKPRIPSLRQSLNTGLRWQRDARFTDFVAAFRADGTRVRVELHGAVDAVGVITWSRLGGDSFVIEQDKIGPRLIRESAIISIMGAGR